MASADAQDGVDRRSRGESQELAPDRCGGARRLTD